MSSRSGYKIAQAYYINIEQRAQMEAMASVRGLELQSLPACTPSDTSVMELCEAYPGKSAGYRKRLLTWACPARCGTDAAGLATQQAGRCLW